jgi:hypothetical protein
MYLPADVMEGKICQTLKELNDSVLDMVVGGGVFVFAQRMFGNRTVGKGAAF